MLTDKFICICICMIYVYTYICLYMYICDNLYDVWYMIKVYFYHNYPLTAFNASQIHTNSLLPVNFLLLKNKPLSWICSVHKLLCVELECGQPTRSTPLNKTDSTVSIFKILAETDRMQIIGRLCIWHTKIAQGPGFHPGQGWKEEARKEKGRGKEEKRKLKQKRVSWWKLYDYLEERLGQEFESQSRNTMLWNSSLTAGNSAQPLNAP